MRDTPNGGLPVTPAYLAGGFQRLIGPAIAANTALFVYVLFEPILTTRFLFFSRHEVTLTRVAYELYSTDMVLFLVVFLFGIVAPGLKLMCFAFLWYFLPVDQARRYNCWVVMLGKLAMIDVMLIAVVVVAIKGIGMGSVEIRPGLYFYVVLVVGSFLLSLWVDRELMALQHVRSQIGR